MTGRTRSQNRCPKCKIHQLLCFCDEIKPLDLNTNLYLIVHKAELHLTSNTANLAHLVLKNSFFKTRGLKDEKIDFSDVDNKRPTYVLFPSDNATPIEELPKNENYNLIVPDGTWSQAKRIVKRESELFNYPKVKITSQIDSKYFLRTEPHPYFLCTYEAIMYTLRHLHGEEKYLEMNRVFTIFVERNLWAKNKLHEKNCTYPIPEKALYNRYHPPRPV